LIFESLLAELGRRGIRPVLRDDSGVKLAGPGISLTPDLIEQARAHKDALLAYLRSEQTGREIERQPIVPEKLLPSPALLPIPLSKPAAATGYG
jgi:hypothetical protein